MTDGAASTFVPGLLDGRVVAVLHPGELGAAASAACAQLGAEVVALQAGALDPLDEDAVGAAIADIVERHGRLDTLVIDAADLFAAAPQDGLAPLRAGADAAWVAARAAGTTTMIEAPAGGKVIVIAPPPGAGPHADAARAGLENFARTLSIEWARYDIRVTTLHPGERSSPADVAGLVAYLASTAGDYFSGCLLSLESTS